MAKSLSELKPKPVTVEIPKPVEVAPVAPVAAPAKPPTAPLPEPPVAAEIESAPTVKPAPKKAPVAAKAVKAATPIPAPTPAEPPPTVDFEPTEVKAAPVYGFSQADAHVLWSALRSEWEKENYRGEKAKTPEQVFTDYAAARGMTADDLRSAASAAGANLDEIKEIAQRKQNRNDSLADFNRSQARGRYTTPEKAKQAAVAEAVTPEATEKDSYSLVARQSPTTEIIASTPDEDPEVTKTDAGKAHAAAVWERAKGREAIYVTGFQRYAQDSKTVFAEAANDILRKGVTIDVVGPDGKTHEIHLNAANALAAAGAMEDAGIDMTAYGDKQAQENVAAKVANNALRRATARAINEAAAGYTLGYFANPIRTSIPFSQLAGLAKPGAYDPLKDDAPLFSFEEPLVDARSRVERGEYVKAAQQALTPLTHIVGLAEIPGRASNQWPVLIRQQSSIETAFDWTDTPYAALRGHFQPVVDALEAGDRKGAARQLAVNLLSIGQAKLDEDGNIVNRPLTEIYADTLMNIEQRQTAFEDVQQSAMLEEVLKKTMFLTNLAQATGMDPPAGYNVDFNNDGKIDDEDRDAGWREAKDDLAFARQNLIAFGAAVVTLDAFDALAAVRASRLMRQAVRATEIRPSGIGLLDKAADALETGRYEEAGTLERKVEYRPGHSSEPQGAAVAAPDGNAPQLGTLSRVVDSITAHEMKATGKADEMFDTATAGALPDIPKVATSGTQDADRRFYLHGSVRTTGPQVVDAESLRARYDFRHRYNIVDALERAVADGTDTYASILRPKFEKAVESLVETFKSNGIPDVQAEHLGAMWSKAVERGEDIATLTDTALEAHLKGNELAAAKKASKDLGAAVKKAHTAAKKEGKAAVERVRRAVDQQVKARVVGLRKTAEFVRGADDTRFGRWMQEKMPFVGNWLATLRAPKNLLDLVDSETLRMAAVADVPAASVDVKKLMKSVDSAEKTIAARKLAVEAAQIAGDEAAEKKAQRLLKSAMTRRDGMIRTFAASINGRGHVLSGAGIETFLAKRAVAAGQIEDAVILADTILHDLRAEKLVEEGVIGSVAEYHNRISYRRSDAVEPDALLQSVDVGGVQRPTTNSAGRPIHPTEEGVRNFWRWFGDSKVVDSEGRPLVVYHGTSSGGFEAFKPNVRKNEQLGFGIHFAVDEDFARLYAEDENVARKGKTPQTYDVYLKSGNPLTADVIVAEGTPEFALAKKLAGPKFITGADESGKRITYLQHAIDATNPQRAERLLREAGYDSVRYGATIVAPGYKSYRKVAESQSWVVFDPTQVKSATGNAGTFDPADTSILRQDETPDFIEPERLSRSPRVVRDDLGALDRTSVGRERLVAFRDSVVVAAEAVVEKFAQEVKRIRAEYPEGRHSMPDDVIRSLDTAVFARDELRSALGRLAFFVGLPAHGLAARKDDIASLLNFIYTTLDETSSAPAGKIALWRSIADDVVKNIGDRLTEPLKVLPPGKVPTGHDEMVKVIRDTPWFHGAVKGEVQLREYDPSAHAGSSAGLMLGPGLYLAENPEVAITYATYSGKAVGTAPGKAALKTVMVSPERLLDIRPVEGRAYADVLAERLEAVGLTEDARIVRDSRIEGPFEIGRKWLNRPSDYSLTPAERIAADTIGFGRERMSVTKIDDLLKRVADVTDEPPTETLRRIHEAVRAREIDVLPKIDEMWEKHPTPDAAPADVQAEFHRLLAEQRRLEAIIDESDSLDSAMASMRVEMTADGFADFSGARLSDEEFNARWQKIVEAKKVLEGALENAKNVSSPASRLLSRFDGLFHVGQKDGNVLVLFDPNGFHGGRPLIDVESRVLPERIVYQTDEINDAKAYVQFEADGKAIVTLMKKADASSFIHESAHIFRRTLDATDNATVLRWAKASGLDVDMSLGWFVGPDAVKAEELFARAFEKFAMKGKTPVKGMRRLFENLRAIMLRIYSGSKALDVDISPEVEILFNRMFASSSVATEVAPTIHDSVASVSAAKWLADKSDGLLNADDIVKRLEAGERIRLPFRVFGKDEINLDDFLRLQLQIDEIAQSPEPVFKAPFTDVRQQVVEDTLTGTIQSATSGVHDDVSDAIPRYIGKMVFTVPFGADAFKNERLYAPRFREMAQSGERLLNQRVGDMNVFLREAKPEDGYQPIIRYMTGERQGFRVGGRQPLSAGHDAVRETGDIIETAHDALKGNVVQATSAIDPTYTPTGGVTHYIDAKGEVVETPSAAASVETMTVELAVFARSIVDEPDANIRARDIQSFLINNKKRQNTLRAVVMALMTNGGTDDAANTIFRHLGMAILNNGIMEGTPVSGVIRGSQVTHLLAYVDAVYRLGGYDVVAGKMVKNSKTSAERVADFIKVLDTSGLGPEAINRALVVVNAFGAQRSIYTHISGLGAAFPKEQVDSFHRFLSGDIKSPADYADGLRLFKQFGLNGKALEEAAGLLETSSGRYIPANVQKRVSAALGRALDETTEGKEENFVFTWVKWALRFWQRQVVRGNIIPKAAKAWMDVMDTFFMTSAEAGFGVGARSAGRQAIQTLFISFQGHILGRLTGLGPSKTDRIRSSLQNFADWMVSPNGNKTVNKVLQGSDELYRTLDGRVYRYDDLLKVAIAKGTVSSFESSDLRESIKLARKSSKLAGTTTLGALMNAAGRKVRNAGTEYLQANSELFEAWAERERIGAMMTMIEAGMTPDQAARTVTRALFDYPGSLAAAETKGTPSGFLLTLAQPFWAFQKNINHYVFNALERPDVMYRLTKIRRAVEYGQEAVAQTIYGFYVDPYGFDFNEMSPETRESYYHLRYAYEESLGKMPHQMTVEERLNFAASMMAGNADSPLMVDDGKFFRLPAGEPDAVAPLVSRLPGGVNIESAYRPEPRRELLSDVQRRKITTFFPAKRTDMLDPYTRATSQQDLQYAVAFFEPAPFAGMTYLANTLALYAYPPSALIDEDQDMSNAQSMRAIKDFIDPERMPLASQVATVMQTGRPQQVSPPLVAAIQAFPGGDAWIYPVSEPLDIPTFNADILAGMPEETAGRGKPVRWYAVDPWLAIALQVPLYDINQLGNKVSSGGGAFDRSREMDVLRRIVALTGPATITEVSQRKAAQSASYEVPSDQKPR